MNCFRDEEAIHCSPTKHNEEMETHTEDRRACSVRATDGRAGVAGDWKYKFYHS